MSDAIYYKTEDGRILCPNCLGQVHPKNRGDAELFAYLKCLPGGEHITIDQKALTWKFFRNRVHSMTQYLKRSTGKKFTITPVEDLKKIVVRRIE